MKPICLFRQAFVYTVVLACLGPSIAIGQSSQTAATNSLDGQAVATTMFSVAEGVISFENRSRRKWDCPLVADLDQDGHQDLLLTEHGLNASVYWNNGGTFSEPMVVARNDTHGMTAGDYDQDGRIDLIVSQGGGDGSNPRNPVAFQVNKDRRVEGGEQFGFLERSRGRAAKLVDIDNDGVLDLVLSAFPLKTQTRGANHLYVNAGEGDFDFETHLPNSVWMSFNVLVTDFNNDGVHDLLFYGGDEITVAQGKEGHAFDRATKSVLGDLAKTSFVKSIGEIDFDNDGDFDLFLTRAEHAFSGNNYYDAETKRYAFFERREKFVSDDLKIDGDFKLENLQMAFPHFDVMVGAEKRLLKFDVDRHGHKDVTLKPEEAEGWPEDTSAKGLHIGHLGDGVWRIAADTQAPTTGVILNVTSTPEVSDVEEMPAKLFENRNGVFVDVTTELGISIPEQATSCAVGDFNNDGWSDLFVVRQGNPTVETEQIILLNLAGKGFERLQQHGVISKELGATGGGAEVIDYDEDGDLDLIFANERGRWHLFTNNGLSSDQHNYVVVKVGKSPEKKTSPLGAVLELKSGGNTYRRVVGSTASGFGLNANTHLHIGLGSNDRIDSASVRWTNGETQVLEITAVNQPIAAGHME